jgi:hypothetical protein
MPVFISQAQRQHLYGFLNQTIRTIAGYPLSKQAIENTILAKLKKANPQCNVDVVIEDSTIEFLETILKFAHQNPFNQEDLFEACDAYNYDLIDHVHEFMFLPDLKKLSQIGIITLQGETVTLNVVSDRAMDLSSTASSSSSLGKRGHEDMAAISEEKVENNSAAKIIFRKVDEALLFYVMNQGLDSDVLEQIVQAGYARYNNFASRGSGIEKNFCLLPEAASQTPQLFCSVISHRSNFYSLNRLKAKLAECDLSADGEFRLVNFPTNQSDRSVYFAWFEHAETSTKTLEEIADIWQKKFKRSELLSFITKKPKTEPVAKPEPVADMGMTPSTSLAM